MEEREVEEVSELVFESMLNSEGFRQRVTSVIKDSGEFSSIVDVKVKESLRKSWLTIAIQAILLISGIGGFATVVLHIS